MIDPHSIKIGLIDIGLNLTHDSFDIDREALLARAAAVGVRHMIVTGSSLASTEQAIALVQRHPERLRATAGVHPHHAEQLTEDQLPALRHLMQQPQIVAAGECGLDYFRNFSSIDAQQRAFRWQLQLANEVDKPVFLHQRDAHDTFMSMLREHPPKRGGVAHCFTGDQTQAKDYLDLGLYIGITGWICDERRGASLREAIRYVPSNRLLIETDAPYLLPRDIKPKPASRRNEPMYLQHIVQVIAQCRDESVPSVIDATVTNTQSLFGWPEQSS